MYKIKLTKEFGRGLYATRSIGTGEIIFEAELLVLSPDDTVTVNKTDLSQYTFKFSGDQDCLVLGDGELFNHADYPNVEYRLIKSDGRTKMQFYATQDIAPDEQLFIDYSFDESKTDVTLYTKNLVG